MEVEIVEIDAACRYKKHLTSHWVAFDCTVPRRTAYSHQLLLPPLIHSSSLPPIESHSISYVRWLFVSFRYTYSSSLSATQKASAWSVADLHSSPQSAASSWQLAAQLASRRRRRRHRRRRVAACRFVMTGHTGSTLATSDDWTIVQADSKTGNAQLRGGIRYRVYRSEVV